MVRFDVFPGAEPQTETKFRLIGSAEESANFAFEQLPLPEPTDARERELVYVPWDESA